MDLTKLATLKRKLIEATDFTEIVEYYFEEFGNDPEFARSGTPMKDARFAEALARVAVQTVGLKTSTVFQGTPCRIASHRFVHGAFTLGKWTAMMFYFEDVEQGFMALGDDSGPSHFTRFSLIEPQHKKHAKLH